MARHSRSRNLTAIATILSIGIALSVGIGAALAADEVTEDQILRALTPAKKPLTRGLSIGGSAEPAASPAESKFVSSVRGRSTRSLSANEREEIAAIVKDKPKIDLEITFDYNSAEISANSIAAVQALADRRRTTARLRAMGATVIDAAPGRLGVDVTDAYLLAKSTGRLCPVASDPSPPRSALSPGALGAGARRRD